MLLRKALKKALICAESAVFWFVSNAIDALRAIGQTPIFWLRCVDASRCQDFSNLEAVLVASYPPFIASKKKVRRFDA
ncbi:MAG: hypothetical protein WBA89_08045 [Microcoleus sp.]|uniref:hypothetical protein n=1 Tax=Microcoleus sp. TaxID=44472 RepID=UPI003C7384BD